MNAVQPLIERFRNSPVDPESPVLFAVPHAGAGASTFAHWRTGLPESVEIAAIRLPGRESSIAERPLSTVREAAQAIASAIEAWGPREMAIFGQCSGAVVSFEVARELARRGLRGPAHLFVASQRAPGERDSTNLHELPDEDFHAALTSMETLPGHIAVGTPLWSLLAPAIRADFQAMETYVPEPGETLTVPITAIIGEADEFMPPEAVAGWSGFSSGGFQIRQVAGGHLPASSPEILPAILETWTR